MRSALQGLSVACVHSLTQTRQEEMVSGEKPASPTTSCGIFPLYLPRATVVAWGVSRVMSLPIPFRTCLWSCSQWIWLTPFEPADTGCLNCLTGQQAHKVTACCAMKCFTSLKPISSSFNKFILILLLQNWWLTISSVSQAPYSLSLWWPLTTFPPAFSSPEAKQSFSSVSPYKIIQFFI